MSAGEPSADLLPCPFCGGPARMGSTSSGVDGSDYVSCANAGDCPANPDIFDDRCEDIVAAWNTRPDIAAAEARAAETERARVVAWLRERFTTWVREPLDYDGHGNYELKDDDACQMKRFMVAGTREALEAVERGEHLTETTGPKEQKESGNG